jgi:hypothetical protein
MGAPSQRWPAPKKKVYNGKWYNFMAMGIRNRS